MKQLLILKINHESIQCFELQKKTKTDTVLKQHLFKNFVIELNKKITSLITSFLQINKKLV